MPRHEVDYVVQEDGRDKGKCFHIREAPASKVEWWATRVYAALEKQGIDVGGIASHGAAGLIVIGARGLALIPEFDLKPLLDEMMACVTIKPDRSNPALVRPLINDGSDAEDIEEIRTRLSLRQEIAKLHLGFSLAGATSTSEAPKTQTPPQPASPNTATSPVRSARRFHPAAPHSAS